MSAIVFVEDAVGEIVIVNQGLRIDFFANFVGIVFRLQHCIFRKQSGKLILLTVIATEETAEKAITTLETLKNGRAEADGAECAERYARAFGEIFSHTVTF